MARESQVGSASVVEVPPEILHAYKTAHTVFSVANLSPDQVTALFSGKAVAPETHSQANVLKSETLGSRIKTTTANFFRTLTHFNEAINKNKQTVTKVASKTASGAAHLRRAILAH